MEREHRSDRFTALEDQYAGYEVYDRNHEKIGKVDDLFVDENDRPEYLGVKMGFLGLEGTSLIPWELTRVDEQGHRVEVSVDKAQVKEGPSFNDDEDITPQYENEVRSHYGVGGSSQESVEPGDRGAYGDYYGDEDELRVQRTEEELRVGTREREAGAMRVRKRVRTDREQVRVPKRHEEVSVERVPVEGREASEAEIGEDEVVMPVTEEEVVVEKRPVVKEEIRVRKDVVEDEEVVEEDVRKEEVDVEDQTERGGGRLGRDTDLPGGEETRRRDR
jgi:uncharacterized protein (TIGR02271 family)